jgi:hypothetical protein
MPVKGYRPPDMDRVTTDTDILEDLVQRRAREEFLPMIAQKSRNALNSVPVYIEYFQRLKTGRRCSCFTVETDPAGTCPCCFGTSIVGGYTKRGTKTEVFDVTYQNVATVNVQPEYGTATRPIYWSLVETAVYGTIEFSVQLNKSTGILDVFDIRDYQPTSTLIQYYIKTDDETDFTTLTRETLEQRLNTNLLHFKIVMRRKTPSAALPKLQLIRFSYKLIRITGLKADVPRVTESKVLEELGIYQDWSSQQFFLDNTLKNCTTDDFIVNLYDNTRWKIQEVESNKPLNITLSWDLTCRIVQEFEPYYKVPIGILDTDMLPAQFVRSTQTDKELVESSKLNPGHMRLPDNRIDSVSVDQNPVEPGLGNVAKPRRQP